MRTIFVHQVCSSYKCSSLKRNYCCKLVLFDMEKLNDDQQYAYRTIVDEKISTFLTGGAGTGKSYLVEKVVTALSDIYGSQKVAVTALTGVAAFNVGGCTIHSFAGIGLGTGAASQLAQNVRFNPSAAQRWKKLQVLIIDEISMMDGDLFDKLEYIARTIRGSDVPFGGIQLVTTGDFMQLPPVEEENEEKKRAFEAVTWSKCINKNLVLRKVVRQSDENFVRVLTSIRFGHIDESVSQLVDKMCEPKTWHEETEPVLLYPTRSQAERYNRGKLDELETQQETYVAEDKIFATGVTSRTLDSCPAHSEITLKVGAQVMLVKNVNNVLVNGTVGVITRFVIISLPDREIPYSVPVVRFTLADGNVVTRHVLKETWSMQQSSGRIICSRTQIPLILSWAVTIHKSQGKTIQFLRVDLGKSFAPGQVYTALSRAVSLETLEVINFDPGLIKVDPKSLEFYAKNDLV